MMKTPRALSPINKIRDILEEMGDDDVDDGPTGVARKRLEDQSQGRRYGNIIGSLSLEGLQVVRVQKGSILCNLVVPEHLADHRSGNWHCGALSTLIDHVGVIANVSLIGNDGYTTTVDLSVSFLSTVKIGEEVEIEAKVLDHRGKLTSTIVEVRKKETAEMVALGKQWVSVVKAERSKL
ncbi:acyl-coenzyme A thioesterase 13-like [Macadamia integrifolia]|uniref:acyl-coenzyme A thioesterase 13-like n=1 Tax=Macadamia integrifolia TaxID=60698 RepID=UPI001C4E6C09|nr:acyl-coenzyme A thioesterase 13-like [Macadamia integrifolia]